MDKSIRAQIIDQVISVTMLMRIGGVHKNVGTCDKNLRRNLNQEPKSQMFTQILAEQVCVALQSRQRDGNPPLLSQKNTACD